VIRHTVQWAAATFVVGFLLALPPAAAAELPKATRLILAQLNKSESLLQGLDSELAVPAAWIEGARKEGTLIISGTWDDGQFRKMMGPFIERYPFLKPRQLRGDRQDRVIKPLLAFSTGRITTDVIGGVGSRFSMFENAGAAMDLRDLPGWSNIPEGAKAANGLWVAQRLRYWCTAYNTELVAKADLPKTWDDILSNPRWHGKKIGLGDRPNLWLLNLMSEKGQEETRAYMQTLFDVVQPQLRKEGINALVSLVVAGEFQLSMPSASDRVTTYMQKRAPIGWHCPEPVPAAVTGMLIINGNPHVNASKLFVNWLISKEGQIAQYAADANPPAHKDLQTRDFVELADEIVGKKVAFGKEENIPWLLSTWYPMWTKSGGNVDKKGQGTDD
jgi:ABC-type Fe3+ transport system substrate-binding protein